MKTQLTKQHQHQQQQQYTNLVVSSDKVGGVEHQHNHHRHNLQLKSVTMIKTVEDRDEQQYEMLAGCSWL
jgi:hypothetical protein